MKILLAVDGSACSEAAVGELTKRPWPPGSEIRVLTAYDLPLMPGPEAWAISPDYCDRLQQAVLEQAEIVAHATSEKLSAELGDSFKVTSRVVAGSPKLMILEEAEQWNPDLIVVGSHGYSGWQKFLLGSVSQAVVAHAKCSVEVVRCKAAEATQTAAA
jgi:nucleotide-binding universal stress UspA family protein